MTKSREKQTVLVIEDDPKILQFATWLLELEGYRALKAEEGDEGLKLARDNQVALVLLDLRLPGRDGWSVLEEMKGSPELSAIPVIVFTASAAVSQQEKALGMGAVDYLTKPISATGLKEAITQILHPER